MASQRAVPGLVCLLLALQPSGSPTVARAQERARVTCEATDNGAPTAASFRVLRGEQAISSGSCGSELELPPGSYALAITPDGVLGAPATRFPVEAIAGQSARVQARFESGELLVEVARDGRRSVGLVVLYRGEVEIGRGSAGVASRVATGTYTVVVESRGERRRQEGLTIARGERRVLRFEFGAGAPPK